MWALYDFSFCTERNADVLVGSEQSYMVSIALSIERSGSIGGEGQAGHSVYLLQQCPWEVVASPTGW